MRISSRTAALLDELSEALDEPDGDIARSLTRFADQVKSVVPSYLGLSVEMTTANSFLDVDAMEDAHTPGRIRSSLRIPTSVALGQPSSPGRGAERIAFVLYAASPGALVDLAADLAWLTSLPLTDFALDQHLAGPGASDRSAEDSSVLNQAIGILLNRGLIPDRAMAEIDRRAALTGLSRNAVAAAVLAELSTSPLPLNPSSEC